MDETGDIARSTAANIVQFGFERFFQTGHIFGT